MKYIIAMLVFSLAILSCEKNEGPIPEDEEPKAEDAHLKNLDELEVGDEFNYVLFQLESYYDPDNSNFTYTKDTLNVEICGLKEGKFVVQEKITPGSAMFQGGEPYYYFNPDSIFTNFWYLQNDSLIIEQKDDVHFLSHLFYGTPKSLNLLEFTENEVEMDGWKTTYGYIEDNAEAYLIDEQIGNTTYPYLNVWINNSPMAADGDGHTFIYSKNDGIISASSYSAWTSTGFGWELIVE